MRTSGPTFSAELLARMCALVDRFDAAWQAVADGGATPRIEDVLDDIAADDQPTVLRELLAVELECRHKRGEQPATAEYMARFPNHAELVESVVREEMLTHKEPSSGRKRRRFSARLNCPHCHNPIEIVSDSVEDEVLCPSCGSAVHLDTGRSLTWDKQRLPQIAQFELLEAVGRGAFGTVYKARDQQLQRVVAVKLPRNGVLATDEDEDRFLGEARKAAQLQHPGIVTIYSVGRSDTFPYLVSEFVEGITLSDALTAKRYSFREAADLVRDVARALQHAHEHGVVHRDLKPSNIMLTPEGVPRVMDFGCAKRDVGEITMTLDGQILGTPAYMSPEQARGFSHQADARSDVYSLGVIFFQMLTGELPFRGNARMLLHQVIHDEAPNPRKLNNQIPRDLDTICLKCLAKEPKRRYASAGELADDLQRHLDQKPILARPIGRIERTWRWCRRNALVASLSAVVVVVLLTGTAVSSFFALQSAARNRDLLKQTNRANAKAMEAQDWAELQKRIKRASILALSFRDVMPLAKFSPNGEQVLTGGIDHSLQLWDCETFKVAFQLAGHLGTVRAAAFSPDSKMVVTSADDGLLKIWSTVDGTLIRTLHSETSNAEVGHIKPLPIEAVPSVAFSPDGTKIVSGGRNHLVKLWEIATGDLLLSLGDHTGVVTSVAFDMKGERIVSGSTDKSIKIWNVADGEKRLSIPGSSDVSWAVFTKTGEHVCRFDKARELTIYNAVSGEILPPECRSAILSLMTGQGLTGGSHDVPAFLGD